MLPFTARGLVGEDDGDGRIVSRKDPTEDVGDGGSFSMRFGLHGLPASCINKRDQ